MKKKSLIKTSSKAAVWSVGTGLGLVFGPGGSLLGSAFASILSDVLEKSLSDKSKSRVQEVYEISKDLITSKLNSGSVPSSNKSLDDLKVLLEGTLLTARDSYEERKVPLLANLNSNATFTNTPIENLIETLKLAESLSFRKLCIISVVGKKLSLSKLPFKEKYKRKAATETVTGVYFDILSLSRDGILVQTEDDNQHLKPLDYIADIITDRLKLYGLGPTIFNGLQLDNLNQNDKEFKKVYEILKQ